MIDNCIFKCCRYQAQLWALHLPLYPVCKNMLQYILRLREQTASPRAPMFTAGLELAMEEVNTGPVSLSQQQRGWWGQQGEKYRELNPNQSTEQERASVSTKWFPPFWQHSLPALEKLRLPCNRQCWAVPGVAAKATHPTIRAWQALSMQSAERREWQAINIPHSHGSSQVTEV